ncbi:MAG: glycosyltransferase family 2 protein [Abditibacteriota bacterium]|nr:glycosyltransferase family 2 protein [Abditibacteriota bacterium]
MFFSVLIPVYNVEKYLRRSIDSVLAQDFDDYEIILCDDGSTDQSGAICDEYAQKDSKIRVIHKENEGLILTRRVAIRASKGEYLIHLDSDDYMLPGCLSSAKKAIDETGADMVIWQFISGVGSHPEDLSHVSTIPFKDGEIFEGEGLYKLRKHYILATGDAHIGAMFQKATKRDINDIDFDYHTYPKIYCMEDVLQSVVLYNNVKKAVFINKPFIYYSTNPEGITHGVTSSKLKNYIDTIFFMWTVQDKIIVNWFTEESIFKKIRGHRIKTLLHKIAQMKRLAQKNEFIEFCDYINNHDSLQKYYNSYNDEFLGSYLKLILFFFKRKKYASLWYVMDITEKLYPTLKGIAKKMRGK